MRVVGIDPGKKGSAALYVTEPGDFYGVLVDAIDLPLCEDGEIIDAMKLLGKLQTWAPDDVWIERVWAMPSFPDKETGERRQMGAATSFTFGDVVGTIRTTVVLARWPRAPRFVTSPVWKLFFGLKGPDKEQSRQLALALLPAAADLLARKKDSGRAEAALIARYGAAMMWADAGGAIPVAEIKRGQELKARLQAARRGRRQARPDDEVPPP